MENKGLFAELIILIWFVLPITGCGNGDVPASVSTAPGTTITGNFLDSPVEGLDYQIPTLSGTTDSQGTFKFKHGENITFSIGTVILGAVQASQRITPIDLVVNATDEQDPTVTNICRFLQSIDLDGIPTNGIQISAEIKNEIDGRSIDFSQSTEEFETNTDITTLFNTLNELGLFSGGSTRTLCSCEDARAHMKTTLDTLAQCKGEGKIIFHGAFYQDVDNTLIAEGVGAAIELIENMIFIDDYLVTNDGTPLLILDVDLL